MFIWFSASSDLRKKGCAHSIIACPTYLVDVRARDQLLSSASRWSCCICLSDRVTSIRNVPAVLHYLCCLVWVTCSHLLEKCLIRVYEQKGSDCSRIYGMRVCYSVLFCICVQLHKAQFIATDCVLFAHLSNVTLTRYLRSSPQNRRFTEVFACANQFCV
jgi:hypothetical protein